MISRLKRLVNSNDSTGAQPSTVSNSNGNNNGQQNVTNNNQQQTNSNMKATNILNNGMHYISESLQKKFSRGVNYNSKFSIKKMIIFD